MNRKRRSGIAAVWIVLIVLGAIALAFLLSAGGLVAWKMTTENQGGTGVTTQPTAR